MQLHEVLHKPTPPPNDQNRWHIVLQGHPEELLTALQRIATHEDHVIKTAEWLADDELVICLTWIDKVIQKLVREDIANVSDDITIKHNGRAACHGHNLT